MNGSLIGLAWNVGYNWFVRDQKTTVEQSGSLGVGSTGTDSHQENS